MSSSSPLKYFSYVILSLALMSGLNPVYSNYSQATDSISKIPATFKAEELIRGERLFFGLVYTDNKKINCARCHNTRISDTLNWNPDAVEISRKFINKSAGDLGRVLLTPSGVKMAQVHKDIKLSPEDIALIKAYMDKLPEIGLKQDKPVITNLILFIIASVLFLFSLIDLIIIKRLKKLRINLIILTFSTVYITWSLVVNAIALSRSTDYSPDQPVKFSHQVHAGQNATDCIYCHSYAPYSKSAGIPPENVCMNCHLLVRNGTRSGAFEISKVTTAYENKEPIEWIRIHNLPDHVFFSHAQHVSAGMIGCTECHGQVEKMARIRQVSDLSMGWCINCHRTRKVRFIDNKFYSEYKDLADKMKSGIIDSVTEARLGGTECMKCHY